MKRLIIISLLFISTALFAASNRELYHQDLSALKGFSIDSGMTTRAITGLQRSKSAVAVSPNQLRKFTSGQILAHTVTRYQQYYKGLPVIGGVITMAQNNISAKAAFAKSAPEVNGHVYDDLQIDTTAKLSKQQALSKVQNHYLNLKQPQPQSIELQIRFLDRAKPRLVYQISYKLIDNQQQPSQPVFIVDAMSGELLRQWDNIKHISSTVNETGMGGNLKTGAYFYGQQGLPALRVTQYLDNCAMENEDVRLVNLEGNWDWYNNQLQAHQYPCHAAQNDEVNGAYSPINDAFVFGGIIVDMYRNWYHINALQDSSGQAMPLIMRVHFGMHFDNAFWDGQTMSFGDGNMFYPLVSLDVAGHEVSHGFTEQHSNLEYHDQSGAINEAFSDMAGMTTRAYLLETQPVLHQKVYLGQNILSWGIGETITKSNGALRYMEQPSKDGQSADCFDKAIALAQGEQCVLSYEDVVVQAKVLYQDEQRQQNYIVHSASGIFNRAFYLMAQQLGIKRAFEIMIYANFKYWTQMADFQTAARGVIRAGQDLGQEPQLLIKIFKSVGIKA